jgi:flagellar biosynthesis/type III secretory pathway protein FliH
MNPTITETKRARRRTFKEVSTAAYERGFAEGVERTLKNATEEWDRMCAANTELAHTVLALETKLANVSLRKLAWSRIKGLFGAKP